MKVLLEKSNSSETLIVSALQTLLFSLILSRCCYPMVVRMGFRFQMDIEDGSAGAERAKAGRFPECAGVIGRRR